MERDAPWLASTKMIFIFYGVNRIPKTAGKASERTQWAEDSRKTL